MASAREQANLSEQRVLPRLHRSIQQPGYCSLGSRRSGTRRTLDPAYATAEATFSVERTYASVLNNVHVFKKTTAIPTFQQFSPVFLPNCGSRQNGSHQNSSRINH
ncbi:MAG: hypothetical protein WAO83_11005 [Fuerstiella sp.]